MKILLPLVLLICSLSVSAQMEYGKASDLRGLKKVFIDTGSDMETRERIIKQLEKANLDIEILDSDDEAEIMMVFRDEKTDTVTGINTNTTESEWGRNSSSTIVKVPLIAGEGRVFVKGANGKARLVLSVKNSQQSRLEKRPSTKFANAFIKAYKEGNGLKK